MKRLLRKIYSDSELIDLLELDQIVSIVLVDDVSDFEPRDRFYSDVVNSSKDYKLNLRDLNRDQILEAVGEEGIAKIDDIDVLRNLLPSDLNPAQKVKVGRANRAKITNIPKSEISKILIKLKQCHRFYIDGTEKNGTFADEIYNKGGLVQDKDARNIVKLLEVNDYKYGTRSDLDKNWCNLLLVFRFRGSYSFDPAEEGGDPVVESNLDLYVKIDVEKETRKGYCVMSFHRWGEHDEQN